MELGKVFENESKDYLEIFVFPKSGLQSINPGKMLRNGFVGFKNLLQDIRVLPCNLRAGVSVYTTNTMGKRSIP